MAGKMGKVSVLRREGCHLCDSVESLIRSLRLTGLSVEVIDVDRDSTLQNSYGLRVPVVVIGGREVFEAKVMDVEGRWRGRLATLLESA